jgi:phage gp29-like protein
MANIRTVPGLVDQFGHPIERSTLTVEQAAPSLSSVRNILSGHPADGLTPQRLGRILRDSEVSDARTYLELAEQMEERDLHYLGVIGKRKRSISQLEITVIEASSSTDDKAAAQLVRDFVDRLELQDELFDMLDAIGKGYSVTEICWDTSMDQWMPRELKYRLPTWFRLSPEDGETFELWETQGYAPLQPYHFITHKVRAKSGLAIRGGLARAAAWAYLFKNFDLKSWVIFADTYGQPIRVGKYGPGASKEDKATLLRAVSNIATDCAAIIPETMALELIEAKMTGNADLFQRLASYLDQQISKAVLGNVGTTDAIAGGHAVGKVHRQVEMDIEKSDAKSLETTLNRDLVRPLIDLNMGPRAKYPRILFAIEDEQDAVQLSQAVATLVDRGLRVGQADMRRRIGIDEPKEGEEVLLPAVRPAAAGPAADGPAKLGDSGGQQPTPAILKDPTERVAVHSKLAGGQDSIDALIAEQMGDWQAMTLPVMQPILEFASTCKSYDEFLAGLPGLVPVQNAQGLTEALAKSIFAARLAGVTRANIGPT